MLIVVRLTTNWRNERIAIMNPIKSCIMNRHALQIIFFAASLLCLTTISAQSNDIQDKYYFNNLIQITTEDQKSNKHNLQSNLYSNLLAEPYTITSKGIYTEKKGDLFIRIKPLEFENVAPMPGSYKINNQHSNNSNCLGLQ